ncbi:MAG: hypothetical protein ACLVCW_05400 [Campylobacter sp.]
MYVLVAIKFYEILSPQLFINFKSKFYIYALTAPYFSRAKFCRIKFYLAKFCCKEFYFVEFQLAALKFYLPL